MRIYCKIYITRLHVEILLVTIDLSVVKNWHLRTSLCALVWVKYLKVLVISSINLSLSLRFLRRNEMDLDDKVKEMPEEIKDARAYIKDIRVGVL